jgi:hypothetical protein
MKTEALMKLALVVMVTFALFGPEIMQWLR